jgi:hypothetical protein
MVDILRWRELAAEVVTHLRVSRKRRMACHPKLALVPRERRMVPVHGYAKEGDVESVEFGGIAA